MATQVLESSLLLNTKFFTVHMAVGRTRVIRRLGGFPRVPG
jgi:hypothetical protein